MKRFISWVLLTFFIYILLATAVMFSRQTTLDAVRVFDFSIFYRTVLRLNKNTLLEDFKYIADTLTSKKGQTVFFPVALLKDDLCIENGNRTDLICSKYHNLFRFTKNIKNIKPRDYYGIKIYDFGDGTSYLYKKIDNHTVLIGDAGKYLLKSRLQSLLLFMKEDWLRYFMAFTPEKGKYGAISKTWQKTKVIFYITFLSSMILYLLQFLYFRSQKQKLETLKNRALESDKKLYELNNELNELLYQKLEVENNITKLSKEADKYKKEIEQYKKDEENLNKLLYKKKQEILFSEQIENNILGEIKKKAEQVNITVMTKELENLIDKLHNIKKLWQKELTWIERKKIESEITGVEENIPFTLSLSFILFEKEIVLETAKSCPSYSPDMDLYEMINLISKNKNFDYDTKQKLHSIRKARNQWFHFGTLPKNETIDDLLSVLHSLKVKPTF